MHPHLFIGIDGGGSRCRARISDSRGHTLGEGYAGAANVRLGWERSQAAIRQAAEQALSAAELPLNLLPQLRAGIGLAGLTSEQDCQAAAQKPQLFASVRYANDAHIACLGAHAGKQGGVLILGTGSIGFAITATGALSIGGWGFALSDQASGAWLGREALRQSLWAHEDLSPASDFSRHIMDSFGPASKLLQWSESAEPGDYARVAPLVFEYARRNDPIANKIHTQALQDAAQLLQALLRQGVESLCLLGGLASQYYPELQQQFPTQLRPAQEDALTGALLLAQTA